MKFYVSGELDEELFDEHALERCIKCPFCYLDENGNHPCTLSNETFILEEELMYDDGSLECWLP